MKKRFAAKEKFIHGVITKDNHSEESFVIIKSFIEKFGEDGLAHVLSSHGGNVFDAQGITGTSSERVLF